MSIRPAGSGFVTAHAGVPDHWDVQEDGGESYFRVDDGGDRLE